MSSLITPLDYHIAVRQGLQFLDSYQQDDVSEEEIDFNLNQQQERFIDSLFSTEFQDDQRKLDYLQNVIIKNRTLPALEFETSDIDFEDNAQYAILPADYMHLINYRFATWVDKAKCDLTVKDNWKENLVEWVGVIPFAIDEKTNAPYYENVRVEYLSTLNSKQSTNTIYFRNFALSAPEEISPVAQDILRFFATPGVAVNDDGNPFSGSFVDDTIKPAVYWENYRGAYHPNSFIFVIQDSNVATGRTDQIIRMVIRDGNGNITASSEQTLIQVTHQIWNETELVKDLTKITQQGNAPTQDMLYDFQTQNVFYKPDSDQPLINLTKEKMYIYVGLKSIISAVRMDYVRKPRQISLSLNQTSELADNAPQRIIDWTIERMKLVLENPNVQSLVQHNEIKTK